MYPTQVPLNEDNIKKLTVLFKSAYREIYSQMENASSFGVINRRAILSQIKDILEKLGSDVSTIIEKEIPGYYEQGAADAVKQLVDNQADIAVKTGFNRIHQDAILALIDDTSRSFGESLTGVNRSATLVFNKAVRDSITARLATGSISGANLRDIKKNVLTILHEQGLAALKDKAGHTWELDRYAEMLIRTKSVEARNRGLANRMVENGYDLVQVSSHGATDICGQWEGKILSLTGKSKGYKTVADAEAAGLFHPNCRHAINVIVPELAQDLGAY